jgi:GTPase SAR1 family protein
VQSYARKNYQFTSDYNMVPPRLSQTQGGEIYSKIVPLADKNLSVELFLFDLSGHEFYESIALGMSKNPDLVMVVYDCTNQDSLKSSLKWLDKVKKLNNKSNLNGVLVGTKSEHKTAKEITTEEGEGYAKKLGLDFFEVSAAYNTNVDKPFQELASKVVNLPTTSFS